MRIARRALFTAAALLLVGCSIQPRAATPDRSRGELISSEQIARSGARTMWEALVYNVRHTRFTEDGYGNPTHVSKRGSSSIAFRDQIAIFVDNVRIHDIDLLNEMPARSIDRIQVLSGIDGTTYYGTNAGDGVVLIFTRTTDGPSHRIARRQG